MALSIKSDRADALARELASLTGESITDAVTNAIDERLERTRSRRVQINDLLEQFRALPVVDSRSADEILGYDNHGVPT